MFFLHQQLISNLRLHRACSSFAPIESKSMNVETLRFEIESDLRPRLVHAHYICLPRAIVRSRHAEGTVLRFPLPAGITPCTEKR